MQVISGGKTRAEGATPRFSPQPKIAARQQSRPPHAPGSAGVRGSQTGEFRSSGPRGRRPNTNRPSSSSEHFWVQLVARRFMLQQQEQLTLCQACIIAQAGRNIVRRGFPRRGISKVERRSRSWVGPCGCPVAMARKQETDGKPTELHFASRARLLNMFEAPRTPQLLPRAIPTAKPWTGQSR